MSSPIQAAYVEDQDAPNQEDAGHALWHVDLADIAKQTNVPTEMLLGALIQSTAPADEHVSRVSGMQTQILELSAFRHLHVAAALTLHC